MAMEGTERLAVDHPILDEQHRELFRRFDELMGACQQARGKERIEVLLGYPDSYVVIHFREEERLMDRYSYPGAASHKGEHRHFTGRREALKADLKEKGVSSELVISTN